LSKKCYIVEKGTGVIIDDNFVVNELEDKTRTKKYYEQNKLKKDFRKIQEEYLGRFVFFIFKNMDKLEEILNDNYLIKFLYCCSYIKENGILMLDNNKTCIDKKKLKNLLRVGDKTFNEFYKVLKNNKLINEINNKIYINIHICWQGNKNVHEKFLNKKIKDFTRLYIRTIRELYENTPSRKHKRLSIVYKLISYTNWKYNILCTLDTVEEIDRDKIKPLRIKDIIEILHYDKTNITRFKKDIYSLKYNKYNIFGSIEFEPDSLKSFIVINPLFFYRGDNINVISYLITLFGLSKS
jgi:hypothetical protein